jgi:hypothetical protein
MHAMQLFVNLGLVAEEMYLGITRRHSHMERFDAPQRVTNSSFNSSRGVDVCGLQFGPSGPDYVRVNGSKRPISSCDNS